MSDYISKSKAVESLKKYKFGAISNDEEREYTKEIVLVIVNGLPTVDETEIIRKTVERIVERLEEEETRKRENAQTELDEFCLEMFHHLESEADGIEKAIEIVKEVGGVE